MADENELYKMLKEAYGYDLIGFSRHPCKKILEIEPINARIDQLRLSGDTAQTGD